eukprot:4104133-Prymnesium_polylepis.2
MSLSAAVRTLSRLAYETSRAAIARSHTAGGALRAVQHKQLASSSFVGGFEALLCGRWHTVMAHH